MEKIDVSYQITIPDFRQATYFGLFQRHRRTLQIMFIVLAVSVLYVLGGYAGLGQINYLVPFLGAAYLVWGLLLFAGAEAGIRRYLHSGDSLIGCAYHAVLGPHRVCFEIPERGVRFDCPVGKLACVFELSGMFLIYISLQEVYLLPHRCLTEAQRAALRANFREHLGENFSSRFH